MAAEARSAQSDPGRSNAAHDVARVLRLEAAHQNRALLWSVTASAGFAWGVRLAQ